MCLGGELWAVCVGLWSLWSPWGSLSFVVNKHRVLHVVCSMWAAGCGASTGDCGWPPVKACGPPVVLLPPGSSARLRTSLDDASKLTYTVLADTRAPAVLSVDHTGHIVTSGAAALRCSCSCSCFEAVILV